MNRQSFLTVLLDRYPDVELLDPVVVVFLIFGGASIPLPTVAAPFCIPTDSLQGCQSLHIRQHLFFGFAISQSDTCAMTLPRGVASHPLRISDVEDFFICLLAIYMSFFGEMSFSNPCSIFKPRI